MKKVYTSVYLKIEKNLYKKLQIHKALTRKKMYQIMEEAINDYLEKNPIKKSEIEKFIS